MITRNVRFALVALATILLAWTISREEYELTALVALGIVLLIVSYFRDGTVLLSTGNIVTSAAISGVLHISRKEYLFLISQYSFIKRPA